LPDIISKQHGTLPCLKDVQQAACQKRWKINTIDATHEMGCDG
jgi:hypothetical protein